MTGHDSWCVNVPVGCPLPKILIAMLRPIIQRTTSVQVFVRETRELLNSCVMTPLSRFLSSWLAESDVNPVDPAVIESDHVRSLVGDTAGHILSSLRDLHSFQPKCIMVSFARYSAENRTIQSVLVTHIPETQNWNPADGWISCRGWTSDAERHDIPVINHADSTDHREDMTVWYRFLSLRSENGERENHCTACLVLWHRHISWISERLSMGRYGTRVDSDRWVHPALSMVGSKIYLCGKRADNCHRMTPKSDYPTMVLHTAIVYSEPHWLGNRSWSNSLTLGHHIYHASS